MAKWDIGFAIGGQALVRVDYRYHIAVLAPEWRVGIRESHLWRWEGMVQPQWVGVLNHPSGLSPGAGRPWEVGLGGGLSLVRKERTGKWKGYFGVGTGPHYLSASIHRQSAGPAFSSQLFTGIRSRMGRRLEADLRLGFRHVSNAGMSSPNGGINNSFLRLGLSRGG